MAGADLAFAIAQHLQILADQARLRGGTGVPDAESLDVAVECVSSVFGFSVRNSSDRGKYGCNLVLQNLVAETRRDEAEQLKTLGNDAVKGKEWAVAYEFYSKAIAVHPSAVYFCNRAFALQNLQRYSEMLADCNMALLLDPLYDKAYSRLAIALRELGRGDEGDALTNGATRAKTIRDSLLQEEDLPDLVDAPQNPPAAKAASTQASAPASAAPSRTVSQPAAPSATSTTPAPAPSALNSLFASALGNSDARRRDLMARAGGSGGDEENEEEEDDEEYDDEDEEGDWDDDNPPSECPCPNCRANRRS